MNHTVKEIVTRAYNNQMLHIEYRLPTLNEYINAERSNRYAGAVMKKKAEATIALFIKNDRLKPVTVPVTLIYNWRMKNRRCDKDNISFAQKFIQDALVRCGILQNDGWNNIQGFSHDFEVNKQEGVSVEILERE